MIGHYFSGHTLHADEQRYFVFEDLNHFQSVFHPAATQGPQTCLTEKDFERHIVLAVVEPEAQALTNYAFNTTPYIDQDTLMIDYRTQKIPTPGTTLRLSKILLVERDDYQEVRFIDNGQAVTKSLRAPAHA